MSEKAPCGHRLSNISRSYLIQPLVVSWWYRNSCQSCAWYSGQIFHNQWYKSISVRDWKISPFARTYWFHSGFWSSSAARFTCAFLISRTHVLQSWRVPEHASIFCRTLQLNTNAGSCAVHDLHQVLVSRLNKHHVRTQIDVCLQNLLNALSQAQR